MTLVIASIPCPVCQEPFTPVPNRRGKITEACPAHIRKFNARHLVGIVPAAATAGKQRKAQARAMQFLRQVYGAVSDRELAIFERGRRMGYTQGYNKMYARY